MHYTILSVNIKCEVQHGTEISKLRTPDKKASFKGIHVKWRLFMSLFKYRKSELEGHSL